MELDVPSHSSSLLGAPIKAHFGTVYSMLSTEAQATVPWSQDTFETPDSRARPIGLASSGRFSCWVRFGDKSCDDSGGATCSCSTRDDFAGLTSRLLRTLDHPVLMLILPRTPHAVS